ncbi:ATPase/histidine kinase/DNA gyrase B/HSP90 domain protein [Mycolicibacterium aurum]|uniref:histidine kinase n=1 Tax=Mycolicibacterium aurum TaxID=1791 RepID=A0A3S4RLK1_MYCAU|nr:HAMP domain-containing sensor histidine kinase [Mycolicibacterium aurum]VEG53554.1 ATPase/histidine kinase/DNA gyrase B/HSP90 domain protein [Mycolicibacterium aurum]
MRTIRVRLALTTSLWLSVISAVILAGVYLALSATIDAAPLDPVTVKKFDRRPDGTMAYRVGESFQAADLDSVQRAVNHSTLDSLRNYSLLALGVMFVISLVVGWFVAGRMLRPVGEITAAANRLSASDLSQRINATGPRDELRTLADTIDGMLDRLDEAFRTERALVEDVSHELRNPVAVVQANVEAVLADDRATAEEREHALAVISRATTRMSRLLEDLLATARRRSGSFADQKVDLLEFVGEVVDEHRLLAAERPLQVSTRLSPGPVVFADPESLGRALSNLLSNAIRLAPSGSELTIGSGSARGWAWIAVRDQGPGIAGDDQQRVFDRFRRGPNGGRRGSGLGLAIARQIVESHEGKMALFSVLGAGSTFVIWLPDRAIAHRPERTDQPPKDCPL